MAVKQNPLQRQPSNLDFANSSQFRFQLLKTPNVEYFVNAVNIPGISMSGDAEINTRYKTIPFMGDTLVFGDLELSFIVNENLTNYREIHDWMIGIAYPKSNQQFINAMNDELNNTKPGANQPITTDKSGTSRPPNPSVLKSDATLTILTNKNNPALRVNFKAVYPTSLSGLNYTTQNTDTEQLVANVTFKYNLYEFEVL